MIQILFATDEDVTLVADTDSEVQLVVDRGLEVVNAETVDGIRIVVALGQADQIRDLVR